MIAVLSHFDCSPLHLVAAGKGIPDVVFSSIGQEIDDLTDSAELSEEEEEKAGIEVIEFYKRLLALMKSLRKSEED
jgi:hypothetical protein